MPHLIVNGAPRCPYCHDHVLPGHAKRPCQACMAWHHRACWHAHGRCSSCQQAAVLERLCAAAPCTEPLNEVVTEPTRVKTYVTGHVDLQQLCLRHAAQSLDQQINLLWISLFLLATCALGGGLVGVGMRVSRAAENSVIGAWTLCVSGFLGALFLAYHLVEFTSLQARLRGRSERPPPPTRTQAPRQHKPRDS